MKPSLQGGCVGRAPSERWKQVMRLASNRGSGDPLMASVSVMIDLGEVGTVSHIHVLLRCSVVVFHHDRVLLLRRRDKDDWALPGGTPHPGEDLLTCARRELREETCMQVNPGTCVFIVETVRPYSHRLIDLVFLSPTRPAGPPRFSEDGLAARFVPVTEIGALNLHPPVARHLHELHHRRDGPVVAEYLRRGWSDTAAQI